MHESTAIAPARRNDALETIKNLVLDAVSRPLTRTAYAKALEEFLLWSEEKPFTKAAVNEYRVVLEARGLAASSINQKLSAIRKLAAEAADNALMDSQLAAGSRSFPL